MVGTQFGIYLEFPFFTMQASKNIYKAKYSWIIKFGRFKSFKNEINVYIALSHIAHTCKWIYSNIHELFWVLNAAYFPNFRFRIDSGPRIRLQPLTIDLMKRHHLQIPVLDKGFSSCAPNRQTTSLLKTNQGWKVFDLILIPFSISGGFSKFVLVRRLKRKSIYFRKIKPKRTSKQTCLDKSSRLKFRIFYNFVSLGETAFHKKILYFWWTRVLNN